MNLSQFSRPPRYALLRCPKSFARRGSQDFDRCHSFCSLLPPPAALANVPASGSLHVCAFANEIIHDAPGKCKSNGPVFPFPRRLCRAGPFLASALTAAPAWIIVQEKKETSRANHMSPLPERRRRGEGRPWTNTSCSAIWRPSPGPN